MAWRPRPKSSWNPKPPTSSPIPCSWQHDPVRLHHTVTNFKYKSKLRYKRIQEEKAHMRLLQQIAFGRGFSDISYNFVQFPSGRIYVGRGIRVVGAHTIGYNEQPALALVGNYETQKVTRRQKYYARKLLTYCHAKYGTQRRFIPHCRTYATSCPGRNARAAFGLSCK